MNEIGSKPSIEEKAVGTTVLDLAHLRGKWTWCAKLGVVLIILGILAISMIAVSEVDSVLWLSWLIVVSGMAEAVHAFHLRKSGGFFFHLVPGIAGVPLGLLVATHPAVDIVTWMLVFACFFTIVGLFRMLSAFRLRFPAWRWAVFDSAVMLVFGSVFWTTSTRLGLQFFDIAVGVSLILRGWSSVMLGFGLRSWRTPIGTHFPPSHAGQKHGQTSAQAHRVEAADIS
jgi:uncharacterized membrane protein HdeD (DUF308 family)